MRPTFAGFEASKTGLFISQKGLDVTGHNISNADTQGYTRQRLNQSAINPNAYMARFNPGKQGTIGGGARIEMVDQIRSAFLDKQYRTENSTYNTWNTRAKELENVAALFDESADQSLSNNILDFINGWDKLSQTPHDKGARTNLQQIALRLTDTFHHYYNSLMTMRSDQNEMVKSNVEDINRIAENIAKLNEQIVAYELNGEQANDLRDERNLLMDQLSGLVDYSYGYEDGYMNIKIGGTSLVSHKEAFPLKLDQVADPLTPGESIYVVKWAHKDTEVPITGGELKAHLDLRDGDTPGNFGIPYIVGQLNKLASTFADMINEIHEQCFTMENGGNASISGISFFTSGDYKGVTSTDPITAGNISLNIDIEKDPFMIALAGYPDDPSGGPTLGDDQDNPAKGQNWGALEILKMFDRTNIADIGSFSGFMRTLVVEIGVQGQYAINMRDNQKVIADNVDYNRMSLSNVSLDEELTQMVKFNHSYSANSRMITAMDEALDILINKMGLVGR